jgi:hypothetical protein
MFLFVFLYLKHPTIAAEKASDWKYQWAQTKRKKNQDLSLSVSLSLSLSHP